MHICQSTPKMPHSQIKICPYMQSVMICTVVFITTEGSAASLEGGIYTCTETAKAQQCGQDGTQFKAYTWSYAKSTETWPQNLVAVFFAITRSKHSRYYMRSAGAATWCMM